MGEDEDPKVALFINGEMYASHTARFGSHDPVVQSVLTTTVNPADASTPIRNGDVLKGKVAVIVRGGCTYVEKAKAAQDKGAVAVIIVNSEDELLLLDESKGFEEISIYVCCVSRSTGDALKALGQDGYATLKVREGDEGDDEGEQLQYWERG